MILKAFCTVLGKFDFAASSAEGSDWLGVVEASEVLPNHSYQIRISCESSEVERMADSVKKSQNHREYLFNLFQNSKGELELHWFDNLGHSQKLVQTTLKSSQSDLHAYVFLADKMKVEFKLHDAQCFEIVLQSADMSLTGVCQRRMLAGFLPRLVA